jgi:hypothetical protein
VQHGNVPSHTPETTEKQQRPQLFRPGQSGNPKGRPRGSRNRATLQFPMSFQNTPDNREYVVELERRFREPPFRATIGSRLPMVRSIWRTSEILRPSS